MRILVPVLENESFDSKVSEHFGHAPFFALFDTESKRLEIVENTLNHSDPNLTPADQTMVYNPEMVYVLGIGKKAIDLFKEKGVKLKTGRFKTVKEVVENLEQLEDLGKSCGH